MNELTSNSITVSPLVKEPGDTVTQRKMPGGDVITKIDTANLNATHRQYYNKDGTPGKKTITLMEVRK